MNQVAVAPGTRAKGFDGVRKKVAKAYQVLELRDALTRQYQTDAHLVPYVVPGLKRQPRINKSGLPHYPHPVEMGVFLADIDNPDHAKWDYWTTRDALERYAKLPVLEHAGIYHTAHGLRIVQPISRPIPVQDVEPYLRRWHFELEAAGFDVDWACKDWTRHYRLPHVKRDGALFYSPYVQLDDMQPIDIPPMSEEEKLELLSRPDPGSTPKTTTSPKKKATRKPTAIPQPKWTHTLPDIWHPRVELLAQAVHEVQTEWHTLFLSLAGALLSRGVPHEHVPAICRAVSIATGADTRTEDRVASAQTTAQRYLQGQPATGYTRLRQKWPGVADAVDEVTARGSEAALRKSAQTKEAPPKQSHEEAAQAILELVRKAPPGVTLISAECGLGKSHAANQVALERAQKPHASPKAKGTRAPAGSKTSISVDKNSLAKQTRAQLGRDNAKRIFGPLSVIDEETKEPECRFHESASALANGGQAVRRELCEGRGVNKCEYYDECKAKDGSVGPDNARITVGPHALIGQLNATCGNSGLLVIDEPPSVLEHTLLCLADLDHTLANLSYFDADYATAMKPALLALRAWLSIFGETDQPKTLHDAIREARGAVPPRVLADAQMVCQDNSFDVADCATHAPLPDSRSHSPPIRMVDLKCVRSNPDAARVIGWASRILDTVHHGLTAEWQVLACLKDKYRASDAEEESQRIMYVTSANRSLADSIRQQKAIIAMDANMSLHLPFYTKVLGYEPPLYDFRVTDGAPIKRTVLHNGSANRKQWFDGGHEIRNSTAMFNALSEAFRWIKEEETTRKVGLITFSTLRQALETVRDRTQWLATQAEGKNLKAWTRLHHLVSSFQESWKGHIILGHYGAIRGLNDMKEVDALITLGDPWQNLGQVELDMNYLGCPEKVNQRLEELCRAELEQAHGRLRSVHRTRPGRALHVGTVMPGGTGWECGEVEVRRMKRGRPEKESAMSVEELAEILSRLGGIHAATRAVGCSRTYLINCRKGRKPISEKIAEALRSTLSE